MAKKKIVTRCTNAEVVLRAHETAIAEIIGDKVHLLTGALSELRATRARESALCLEVERLMAESIAKDGAREQLWQALSALRQWHREEYQSNRSIDAQADDALALFSPGRRPN